LIGALILGLVAGAIGKLLMPGKDPGGIIVTILIGLAGSALGYLVFHELLGWGDNDAFDLSGLVGAIIGVMVLLFAYRKFVESREPAAAPAGGGGRHRRHRR
jgi:uncharacterized membrane protein YeaQ/YmgE (transglycosylase-associated protein family)